MPELSTPSNPESGLRNHRTHFAREKKTNRGYLQDVREFLLYSDGMNTVEFSPGASIEERRVMSNADPKEFNRGPESHELTIAYDLCKWFTQNGGNAWDATYDAVLRDADNKLANSHTIVDREDKQLVNQRSTHSGTTDRPQRLYKVARGALADEAEISGDPSDSQPVGVELSYIASRMRSFKIDQPTDAEGAVNLAVVSTDPNDTMEVIVESDGGATNERVTLNGDTLVSLQETYDNVDGFELTTGAVGDVRLVVNTNDPTAPAEGDTLGVILGSDTYGVTGEGDLGVPTIEDGGSRESEGAVPAVETFIGDSIMANANPVPHEVQSATITVGNNVQEMERSEGYGMALYAQNRDLDLETTMYGESTSHDYLVDHLTNTARDHRWSLRGGDLIVDNATLTDAGDITAESEQAVMTVENTHNGTGITVTEAA
jgi:hypothetical protein